MAASHRATPPRALDDSLRRIANQAFVERIYVSEIDTIEPDLGPPFDVLFNPPSKRKPSTANKPTATAAAPSTLLHVSRV